MISVLVMANDSLLADAIVAVLKNEIDLDVIRVTREDLGAGREYSVVILIVEGDPQVESFKLENFIRPDISQLLIQVSLKSRNIFVYESYQLVNPEIERVLALIRDFSRTNLKRRPGRDKGSQKKIIKVSSMQIEKRGRKRSDVPVEQDFFNSHFFLQQVRRKSKRNVTQLIPWNISGFEI